MNKTKKEPRPRLNFEFIAGLLRIFIFILLLLAFSAWGFMRFSATGLPGSSLRYLLPPVFILIATLLAAARYVQDIYNLRNLGLAFKYILASLFSFPVPRLTIDKGKADIKEGEVNLLTAVGGPGVIIIRPGNVVLFERLHKINPRPDKSSQFFKGRFTKEQHQAASAELLRVRGAGKHYISRFERIREIISLDEQQGEIEKVSAMTRDGIEVFVTNVHYRYRLILELPEDGQGTRTLDRPYPISDEAVRRLVYNRTVAKDGVNSWDRSVRLIVDTAITDYVNENTLDALISPGQESIRRSEKDPRSKQSLDPRGEICAQLYSDRLKSRFDAIGTELLWFDIGHFDLAESQVDEERMSIWQAKWMGGANVVRAYGEAQRQAYQEMGRAEAQAEMLMSVINAFNDIGLEGDSRQHLRNVILVRTAQILEAMTEQNQASEPEPSAPPRKLTQ
jgi:hypothetical protein